MLFSIPCDESVDDSLAVHNFDDIMVSDAISLFGHPLNQDNAYCSLNNVTRCDKILLLYIMTQIP